MTEETKALLESAGDRLSDLHFYINSKEISHLSHLRNEIEAGARAEEELRWFLENCPMANMTATDEDTSTHQSQSATRYELMAPSDVEAMRFLRLELLILFYTLQWPGWKKERICSLPSPFVIRMPTFIEPPRMSYEWAPPADRIARHLQRLSDKHDSRIPLETRIEVIRRAAYVCEECSSEGPLEMHHNAEFFLDQDYGEVERGSEKPEHIDLLCRGCHHARHLNAAGEFEANAAEAEGDRDYWEHITSKDD